LPAQAMPSASFAPVLPFSLSSLCRLITELGVDLLHVHDSLATTISIGVSRKAKIPVVLSRRIASPVRRNIFSRRKYSSGKLSAVIAISQTVKDVFAKSGYPDDRIVVVPSGIDIQSLEKVERDEQFRRDFGGTYLVGGMGRLSVKKNWQFMARVAAHIAKTGPDVQWCLAGNGPEEKRLQSLVRELGISSRFHFLGFRADATRILKSVDVLFFPSLMEGASVAVRTAMVLGTPVVAVNAPGTMESLSGNGWIVTPNDVEVAARSVVEALTDTKKREDVVRAARESAVSRFAFDRTVEGTIAVYEKILGD
jgi:glycosyltransferase involved in cell wall biosynthesis